MGRCILKLILAALLLSVVACKDSKPKQKSTTFITENPDGGKKSDDFGVSSPFDEPVPEEKETVAPLLIEDERKINIPEYKAPERIREQLAREIPQYVPPQSIAFEVPQHRLIVNAKTETMTFAGVLKITGKQDEKFELSCKFDKSKAWACGNMYPTNPAVARERRLQATASCYDVYRCDRVGVELFVVINGKTESRLFQSTKFEMRRASSGDVADSAQAPEPSQPTQPNRPPRPQRKDALTDEELKAMLEDSNQAIEIIAPQPVPPPVSGEFSIPEIEKLRPTMGTGVSSQAIGAHYEGRLESPASLPKSGAGYKVRNGADRSYGTDSMIGLIKDAAAKVDAKFPNQSPIMIADISQRYGGRLGNRSGRFHASHQTGLDADVVFPSRKGRPDMWSVTSGGGVSEELDEERLWMFVSSLVCAEKNPVIAIFIETSIKKHMCNWAKKREGLDDPSSCAFKTLRAMKYAPGHDNHFHLRLRCPGNPECRDATVSLGRTTGC